MKHVSKTNRVLKILVIVLTLLLLCTTLGCEDPGTDPGDAKIRPFVFVHGMAGSADQFETHALRFASNGYSPELFSGFEYNTESMEENIMELMDAKIDAIIASTGTDKIDLAGHSMGTSVCNDYLSDPARAAKIAHYINIDGRVANLPVNDVAVMNIKGVNPFNVRGAKNVDFDQLHVQTATSKEAFVEIYKFLNNGTAPATTDILPENTATVHLQGRLITFITNIVPVGYMLSAYEIDPATGLRLSENPVYTKEITADGFFEITDATQGASYEFEVEDPETHSRTHYYYEPFVRTDLMIRLKHNAPDSDVDQVLDKSDNSSLVTIVRNKEMQGDGSNSIKINGMEICTGILPSGSFITGSGPIGLYVFDEDSDGITHLDGVTDALSDTPFVNGMDVYLSASEEADETINLVIQSSGGPAQTINVPNWVSIKHRIVTQFRPL